MHRIASLSDWGALHSGRLQCDGPSHPRTTGIRGSLTQLLTALEELELASLFDTNPNLENLAYKERIRKKREKRGTRRKTRERAKGSVTKLVSPVQAEVQDQRKVPAPQSPKSPKASPRKSMSTTPRSSGTAAVDAAGAEAAAADSAPGSVDSADGGARPTDTPAAPSTAWPHTHILPSPPSHPYRS